MSRTKTPESTKLADPLSDLLGYHLRRLSVRVMADLARALAPLDLNPADASVLLVIEANPGVTQSEIGKAIGILRANMAPLVSALSARGLIDSEPVDGRSNALRLSDRGLAVCRQAASLLQEHEERMFGSMPASSRSRLLAQVRGLWDENA
jgi:DNA-binding MarR family transcriptional regulator